MIPGKAIITPPRIIPFLPKFLLPIEEAISIGNAPGVKLATIISLSKFSLVSSLFSPTKTSSNKSVMPSIYLSNNVIYGSGDGTYESPYILK